MQSSSWCTGVELRFVPESSSGPQTHELHAKTRKEAQFSEVIYTFTFHARDSVTCSLGALFRVSSAEPREAFDPYRSRDMGPWLIIARDIVLDDAGRLWLGRIALGVRTAEMPVELPLRDARVVREQKGAEIFLSRGRSVGKVALMTAPDSSMIVQMLEFTNVPTSLISMRRVASALSTARELHTCRVCRVNSEQSRDPVQARKRDAVNGG